MSDQPIDPSAEQPASEPIRTTPPAESGPQRTQVSSSWMRKMVIFFVVCFGLGSWGLWDAAKVYPDRGRLYAKFMLSDYLKSADETGLIMVPRRVNVEDPAAEIVSLEERTDQLSAFEQLRYRWLSSLRPIYGKSLEKLTEQNRAMEQLPADQREDTKTVFLDPAATYAQLNSEISGSPPKPLSQTDIAVQWLICVVGYAGALLILLRIIQTKSTVYRYEPAEHKLILPKGTTITPGEIETVDKSKWHKFFVVLELKHGSSHKFDLLRFEPLEDWILEMEDSDPRLRAMREEAEREEEAEAAAEAGDGDGGDDD